jgi:uncharacterized protein
MSTVLLTGGNGIIGRHLCKRLQDKGYTVAILSRTREGRSIIPTYTWDLKKMEIEQEAIETADYIIHLAGANISDKRWTNRRKQQIIDSRVKTGQLILQKIKEHNKNLKAFITASAIGYYDTITSNNIFTETNDFLGNVCKRWEQTADSFKELEIRTVKIRTGVVLSKQEGTLSKLIIPVKMGIGSAIGSGKQYMPWIHIEDLCGIYIKAIEDEQIGGAYNAVAPDYKTNEEFTRVLAQVLEKPFWPVNIPSFIMKLMFGEMSGILLKGSRVSPDKIQRAGYTYQFPDLESALTDLISK